MDSCLTATHHMGPTFKEKKFIKKNLKFLSKTFINIFKD